MYPRRTLCTFLSNSGGNFIDFRSLISLSEKRLSWSAEVPLKNPGMGEQKEMVSSAEGYHTKRLVSPASAILNQDDDNSTRTLLQEFRGVSALSSHCREFPETYETTSVSVDVCRGQKSNNPKSRSWSKVNHKFTKRRVNKLARTGHN